MDGPSALTAPVRSCVVAAAAAVGVPRCAHGGALRPAPRSHPTTASLWMLLVIVSTMRAHCGYRLPYFADDGSHDWHHEQFNEVFGVIGVLDRLHGTSKLFLARKRAARSRGGT